MEKPAETRESLLEMKIVINQMRNAIYEIQKILMIRGRTEGEAARELRQMGKNIARSFAKIWKPVEKDTTSMLKEIYKFVFNSKVKIERQTNLIQVTDSGCALCKYERPDVPIPGCILIIGFIEEFTSILHETQGTTKLEGVVTETKTHGNSNCVHQYIMKA